MIKSCNSLLHNQLGKLISNLYCSKPVLQFSIFYPEDTIKRFLYVLFQQGKFIPGKELPGDEFLSHTMDLISKEDETSRS